MNGALTRRQHEVVKAIRWLSRNGLPPTVRELCEALDVSSSNAVHEHLKALERKGVLKRLRGKSRGLFLAGAEEVDYARDAELQRAAAAALRALRRGDVEAATELLAEVLSE